MKNAWRLLAGRGRLEEADSEIFPPPQIDADLDIEASPQGWALSWGTGPRAFRQIYPNFPKLLSGLFEEALRRRLVLKTASAPVKGLEAFAEQLRAALGEARWVCRETVRQVGHRMSVEGPRNGRKLTPTTRGPFLALLGGLRAIQKESSPSAS